MFEGEDGEPYITAQWFYRAKDTVSKLESSASLVFISCCLGLIDLVFCFFLNFSGHKRLLKPN